MATDQSERKAQRDSKGHFLKGGAPVSPGRPAIAKEFRQRCREYMEQPGGGWDTLIAMAGDSKAKEQRYALELIASYAYGKPKQGVELTGEEGAPLGVIILPPIKRE